MQMTTRIRNRVVSPIQRVYLSRPHPPFQRDLSLSQAAAEFPDPNDLYRYMHHYFHHYLPQTLQKHRKYFSVRGRGFGEDAFHAMWYLLIRQEKPKSALEIGVYRGQVITLWALVGRLIGIDIDIHAISPFTAKGDRVSTYRSNIDYWNDTLASIHRFQLPDPVMIRALSTDEAALNHLQSRQWDLIYIDGNHDYDIALSDYQTSVANLAPGGILVMDDSALETAYQPLAFSFPGHPGPSRVVKERAMKELRFIAAVGHNTIFSVS